MYTKTSCTTRACLIHCMVFTYAGRGPGIAIEGPPQGINLILERLNLAACNFWGSDNGINKKIALPPTNPYNLDLKERILKIIAEEKIIGVICNDFIE